MIRHIINQNFNFNLNAYIICDNKYNIAISKLKQMKDAYVKHYYMIVRLRSLVLFKAIDDCGDAFNNSRLQISMMMIGTLKF